MSLSTVLSRIQYLGNGAQTAFVINFTFLNNTDLTVLDTDPVTGADTTRQLGVDYTLTGAGVQGGGTITFTVAPVNLHKITISRQVALVQATVLVPNDALPAKTLETTDDYQMMAIQQINDLLSRSIIFPLTETIGANTQLPNALSRAGKLLGFDASGNFSTLQTIGQYRGVWTTATAYVFQDVYSDPATNYVYIVKAPHTSTTVAADFAANKTAVLIPAPTVTYTTVADFGTDSGAASAYVVTTTPPTPSYTNGLEIAFKAINANSANGGVSTVNVSGLGVKTIKTQGSTDLAINQILAGQVIVLRYDGVNFQLVSDTPPSSGATIVPTGTVLSFSGRASSIPAGYLACDGSAVSRATFATLFALYNFTQTGNTSNGTNSITNLSDTSTMFVGMGITGTGIPASTTVASIVSGTAITISQNATATNTGITLTFHLYGQGDGTTTFNVPDHRRRVAVGSLGARTGAVADSPDTKVGSLGGNEVCTLTSAQLAVHSHTIQCFATPGSGNTQVCGANTGTQQTGATDAMAGGGGSHTNMQPSIVLTKMVKT